MIVQQELFHEFQWPLLPGFRKMECHPAVWQYLENFLQQTIHHLTSLPQTRWDASRRLRFLPFPRTCHGPT